jgi:hypothetical protein
MKNTMNKYGVRFLGKASLLALLAGVAAACLTEVSHSEAEDEALAVCRAEVCLEDQISLAGTYNVNNIVSTGDNWWIGMTNNTGNQTLVEWLEKYCAALGMQAGCFGTHGSPGGSMQVTPNACALDGVKGPKLVLFICSAAAPDGDKPSTLDWFMKKKCSKKSDVFGCSGTLWVFKPNATGGGLKAFCQGKWQNGDGDNKPPFTGIEWGEGDSAPAGEDWQSLCSAN